VADIEPEPNQVLFALVASEVLPLVGHGGDPVSLSPQQPNVEVALAPAVKEDDQFVDYRVIAQTTRSAPRDVWRWLIKVDGSLRRTKSPGETARVDDSLLGGARLSLRQLLDPPPAVLSFLDDAFSELAAAARRPAQLAHWRLGLLEPETDARTIRWSIDGKTWNDLPPRFGTMPFVSVGDAYGEAAEIGVFRDFVEDESQVPPLAREILLEAIKLVSQNPRAALTLGVVAAEVGIKQFGATVSRSASEGWLMMALPSPPLNRLTRRYLPFLTQKRTRCGQIAPPELLKTLDDAVEARNEVVHRGAPPPGREAVTEILASVNDFLYLLDWFAGHEWAFHHLRPETRRAWLP
jgi:hypothetical protein